MFDMVFTDKCQSALCISLVGENIQAVLDIFCSLICSFTAGRLGTLARWE
jgi:hypothetical protein